MLFTAKHETAEGNYRLTVIHKANARIMIVKRYLNNISGQKSPFLLMIQVQVSP